MRGYSVTVACDQPKRRQPLVEANRRILKDGADLSRELSPAILAVPTTVLGEVGHVGGPAAHTRASHAMRPAHLNEEVVGDLRIGELVGRFQHRAGDRLLAIHSKSRLPEWV